MKFYQSANSRRVSSSKMEDDDFVATPEEYVMYMLWNWTFDMTMEKLPEILYEYSLTFYWGEESLRIVVPSQLPLLREAYNKRYLPDRVVSGTDFFI